VPSLFVDVKGLYRDASKMAIVGEIVEELVVDLEKEKLHDDGEWLSDESMFLTLQTRYLPQRPYYGHTTSSLSISRIPSTPSPPTRELWTSWPKH
jgi:hypothetical protein